MDYKKRLEELFQSTPSVGRATKIGWLSECTECISIHALRGEGDSIFAILSKSITRFQSTPSVGRATKRLKSASKRLEISIHALRGEGDSKNIQIYNIVFVHSAYKIIYFCDSCAFYLT